MTIPKSSSQQPAASENKPNATEAEATAPVVAAPVAATEAPVDKEALAKAERERISAITTSDEAKTNTKLANHLAFNTSMSAEDAKEMLKAAGDDEEVKPAAEAPSQDALSEAMASQSTNDGQPQIPADGGSESQAQGEGTEGLLSAFAEATGRDYTLGCIRRVRKVGRESHLPVRRQTQGRRKPL